MFKTSIILFTRIYKNFIDLNLNLFFCRQKLDNIMPTLPGAEDGVRAARKFLSERLMNPNQLSKKDLNVSLVSSTINQLGNLFSVFLLRM